MRRPLVLALALALASACGPSGSAEEGFRVIHVDDLAAMLASPRAPTVLDANRDDFRSSQGIIPGAVLLSSYNKYDVASELPGDQHAPLVFYCADSH
jgi:hypothetical protein